MNQSSANKIPFIYSSLLYALGFCLFLEWLYPVEEITDTSNIKIFIMYALFCFLISLFHVKWWLSILLKGFGMLIILNGLFLTGPFFSKTWFGYMAMEITENIQAIYSQNWGDLTPFYRSMLFLLLIWLMSYLIHYWFVYVKKIILFIILTVIYVTVLDTFTAYDADNAIVRTFIFAFIALGMANMFKNVQQEQLSFSWSKKSPTWLLPIVFFVLFSSVVGYAAPKKDPQWPDPVPFIQGITGTGIGPIQKVGYGEDDSRLGGSFIQDDKVLFQATAKKEHYWRIETKDQYTGKGWERSEKPDYIDSTGSIAYSMFSEQVETESLEAVVEFQGKSPLKKLVYPYGIKQVKGEERISYRFDETSGEIKTQRNGKDASLQEYQLYYDYPTFPVDKMRKTSGRDYQDAELEKQYTQLPEKLPDRIRQLALEITEHKDNRYDQVKAIESYFGNNGFVYQTDNVPIPRKDQDYVDQFLFESNVGYCDNYSTAMVVMVRSLGIPARWVKGFTSGEKVDSAGSNEYDVYEVTNANAHSWVEVFFPNVGWVPFEPTQGFRNLANFEFNRNTDNIDDRLEAPARDISEREQPAEQKDPLVETEEVMKQTQTSEDNKTKFMINKWLIYIVLILLLLATLIMFLLRYRIQTRFIGKKLMKQMNAKTYQDAYHHLLKLLHHIGYDRKPDQTLREFAIVIDERFETHAMRQLTSYYEQLLYAKEAKQPDMKTTQLWKDLVKRIMG